MIFEHHLLRAIASGRNALSKLVALSFVLWVGACSAQDKQDGVGYIEVDGQQIMFPELDEPPQTRALNRLVVHYAADGEIYLDSKPHTLDALKSAIEAALADDEFIEVMFSVEASVMYTDVLPVIEAIELTGHKGPIHLVAYEEDH